MRFKLLLTLSMLLVTIMSTKAQDILTLTDNSVLKVKVLEITPTEIKYKKFDNLNGPTYTSLISGVKSITYENGTTETFNNPPTSQPDQSPAAETTSSSITDQQLLLMDKYYDTDWQKYRDMDWQKYHKRGNTLKLVGIIGGSAVLVTGIIIATACYDSVYLGAPIAGAGLAWGIVFYASGVYQCKKANRIRAASLMTTTLYNSGKSNLTAGVDILGNQNSYGVGIGLHYTF